MIVQLNLILIISNYHIVCTMISFDETTVNINFK